VKTRGAVIGLVLATVFIVGGGLGLLAYRAWGPRTPPSPGTTAETPAPPVPVTVVDPYTGLPVVSASQINRRPLAVMIDNQKDARPQSGLDQAEIVYEVIVEGGITRFMAVYLAPEVGEIGPVRSARHYFLDLALGINAIYVHAGESPQALEQMPALGVDQLDELVNGQYFWLSPERRRPHATYTSTSLLRKGEANRHFTDNGTAPPPLWNFAGEPFAGRPEAKPANTVLLTYPGYVHYSILWQFDPVRGTYVRFNDGQPQTDKPTGKQLAATNIIVQYVPAHRIPGDQALRMDMSMTGQGQALFISGGLAVAGTWQKASREAPVKYFFADGTPLTLHPGNTWVEIIDPSAPATLGG